MTDALLCPNCGSADTHFLKKSQQWECENCEKRFDPPGETANRTQRIFLSYGHDDNSPLVQALYERLAAAGHQVWIDQAKIKVGDDWRLAIKKGLLESDRVLSFLSKHSTRDPGVCLDEIGIALAHRHGAIATLLVEPIKDVSPPPSIAHIQYLDLSHWREERDQGESHWNAWLDEQASKVLDVINRNAGFSGDMDELQRLLLPLTHGGRIGSLIERGFVGREWLLKDIEEWRMSSTERTFWLMAEPGMGKSAIAAGLVHTTARYTIGYHFCRFDEPSTRSPETFVCSIAFQIAARLPGYRTLLLHAARYPRKPLAELQADDLFTLFLANPLRYSIDGGQSTDRLLVIVDALDEAPAIAELLARRQNELPTWLALLVTSRPDANIRSALAGVAPHALTTNDPRNHGDLKIYLDQWFATLTPQPPIEASASLLERSEGNILYLATARAGVANHVFSLEDPSAYPKGLGGLYREWFHRQFGDAVNTSGWPASYALLELVCASPEPLPIAIARRTLNWEGQDRVKAIRPLGSLIHSEGDTLELFHRSLAEWLQDAVLADRYWVNAEDGRISLASTLWAMLPEIIASKSPGFAHRVLPSLLLAIPAERRVEVWGTGDERFESMNMFDKTLAVIYEYEIQFARIDLAKIRVEEYKLHYGVKGTNTLEAMNELANSLCDIACNFKEALQIFENVLKIQEDEHELNNKNLAKSRGNLARIYYLLGDYASARIQYERNVELNELTFGSIHPETATGLSNMAQCLRKIGEVNAARYLNEKTLLIREEIFGPIHADIAESLHQLSQDFEIRCGPDNGRPLIERALKIRENVFGADHPKTADSILELADIANLQGDTETYQKLIQRALKIRETVSGPEHPETAKILVRFASQAKWEGDTSKSIQLFKRILEIHEKIYGHNHLETLWCLDNIASAYIVAGDYVNGKKYYERAYLVGVLLSSEPGWIIITSMFASLGSILCRQGINTEGELLLQKAIEISSSHLISPGTSTFTRLGSLSSYAEILEEFDRFDEAAPLMLRYIDGLEKSIGKDNEAYLSALQNFAVSLRTANRINEAEPLQREVLIRQTQIHTCDSLEVASALSALGAILCLKENKVEAEDCFRKSLSIREAKLGPDDESTQFVRNRLEQLLH